MEDVPDLAILQRDGLRVQMQDGLELGNITDILETGANDVYIIQSAEYGEILLPATDETILNIDLDGGVMMVNPPEGLI